MQQVTQYCLLGDRKADPSKDSNFEFDFVHKGNCRRTGIVFYKIEKGIMLIGITFTLILFLPFAHSCFGWCPSENEKICNEDWISLVKVVDSYCGMTRPIGYTLKHLYVFKKNATFTSWRCKEQLGYPESFCTGRLYWPFTLDMEPLALPDKHPLSNFLEAIYLEGFPTNPRRLRVGYTYILSGYKTTDPLSIRECSSITHQVDDISTDALVRKLATVTPEECVIMLEEAKISNPSIESLINPSLPEP
ncbi:hypothetical protein DdX_17201 [Ditylenchus destructor]|uniref:Uncharacterized protein n=1 Tax=Ditylenchus destructor TaxID=166010 RepID=A0AAD4MRV8_9BILA|nr:hypothetical protein DdX_17201 [Ditylenchus destructor]